MKKNILIIITVFVCGGVFSANASSLREYKYNHISFRTIIEKCDYIYNHSPSNSQLNLWSSIKGSHEEPGGSGVRYFSIENNKNTWNGMTLVAAFGVDDCSFGSIADKSGQCVTVHSATINLILKAKSPIKVGHKKSGIWVGKINAPVEDTVTGFGWYGNAPTSLINHIKNHIDNGDKLYEFECMWDIRPKKG